jgi:hypothetical protein
MTRSNLTSFALGLGIAVGVAMSSAGAADKKAKEGQITGTVHMIEKDKSIIVVSKGATQRQVIYNSDTKWMRGTQTSNKPSSLDELKENWYVNCKGTYDGVKLVASGTCSRHIAELPPTGPQIPREQSRSVYRPPGGWLCSARPCT